MAGKITWLRLFMMGLPIALGFPLIQQGYVKTQLNPDDFYTLSGTDGPFTVANVGDAWKRGNLTADLKPGATFGWETSICFTSDVTIHATLTMERLLPSGDRDFINQTEGTVTPDDKRCGPKLVVRQVPEGTPPGAYQIARSLTAYPKGRTPLSFTLPPVRFEVAKP